MSEPAAVLLVEDNADDVELAMIAFERHGVKHRVVAVSNGDEALDYLRGRGGFADQPVVVQPRLILLDLKMPVHGGLELLRELKSDAATKVIPVVALTSSRDERDIATAYAYGVNSFLAKPVDFNDFVELVGLIKLYWLELNESPSHRAR